MKRHAIRDLRRELERAVTRQAQERGRRARHVLPLVAVFALGITGAAVAVGGAVISGAPDSPDDPPIYAPTATAAIKPLTPADRRRLRRDRERRAPVIDARRYFSALGPRATSRYQTIYRQAGGRVAIRATDREICLQYRHRARGGSTGTCAPTAIARQYGAYVVEQCIKLAPHPQRRIIAGVAADGVRVVQGKRSGVVQASTRVINNAFVLRTDEPIDTVVVGGTSRALPPVAC